MGDIIYFPTGSLQHRSVPSANSLITACLAESHVHALLSRQEARVEQSKSASQKIEQIQSLIKSGRVNDYVFIGYDAKSGNFVTEIHLPTPTHTELFAFAGVTDAIKLEITERAQLAPALMLDGTVLDPSREETFK